MKPYLNVALKYIAALIISIIMWNIFIGHFIYNRTSSNEKYLAYGRKPNTTFVSGKEGYARYLLDNYGYNNDTIPIKNDKYRIITIGNSLTESMQVSREYNYSVLTQKGLQKDYGLKCEVFNLGMTGRTVPDYIGFANEYKEKLIPDHFIILVREEDFNLGEENTNIYKVEAHDSSFRIIKKEMNDILFQKIKNLKDETGWFIPFVGYSAVSFQRNKIGYKVNNIMDKIKFHKKIIPKKTVNKTITFNAKKTSLIRWQMKKLIENYGENFSILFISYSPVIRNGLIEMEMDYSENKNLIKNICDNNGINFIDPTPEFNNAYLEQKIIPFGFHNFKIGEGHLNKLGHEIVSQKLVDALSNIIKEKI